MVLLKSMAEQGNRHFESLAGEKSADFSHRLRRLHILAPDSRLPTSFLTWVLSIFSTSVFSDFSVAKFKNDKTNPIQKLLTHYKERTNPKIEKQKRTQTNPIVDNFLSGTFNSFHPAI
jgi:hypothetical protein